jgi:hypothetical protein
MSGVVMTTSPVVGLMICTVASRELGIHTV